jgi:anhydro-N-acetylmuramic acid kinase
VSLVELYATAVASVMSDAGVSAGQIQAIGAHGQTIRHRPDAGYSVQLNAPARLAEATGIDVIADFRSRDIAAGGHGAPLVPAFHAAVFAAAPPRAVVNIGGISNVTFVHGSGRAPTGFDCGPGNVLLDLHAARHLGQPFDRGGAFAQSGRVDARLLGKLLDEPFLAAAPPKSTGRELFSDTWLDAKLKRSAIRPEDVQRTLTEFTAHAIANAIRQWCDGAQDVVVWGRRATTR